MREFIATVRLKVKERSGNYSSVTATRKILKLMREALGEEAPEIKITAIHEKRKIK